MGRNRRQRSVTNARPVADIPPPPAVDDIADELRRNLLAQRSPAYVDRDITDYWLVQFAVLMRGQEPLRDEIIGMLNRLCSLFDRSVMERILNDVDREREQIATDHKHQIEADAKREPFTPPVYGMAPVFGQDRADFERLARLRHVLRTHNAIEAARALSGSYAAQVRKNFQRLNPNTMCEVDLLRLRRRVAELRAENPTISKNAMAERLAPEFSSSVRTLRRHI